MSYSFNVRAASKDAALEAVKVKLDDVVVQQPIHEVDRFRAQAAVEEYLLVIGEPDEGEEFSISVSGSYWQRDGVFKGAAVGVDISHQRPIAAS